MTTAGTPRGPLWLQSLEFLESLRQRTMSGAGNARIDAPILPPPPRPPFADRVASALFPVPPGLLTDSDAARRLSRQALTQFGMQLLSQAGPSPVPVGLGQAVGRAYQGVNFPAAVQGAFQLQEVQRQLAQDAATRKAIADVSAKYPRQEGETLAQTFTRLTNVVSGLAGIPGTEEMVGRLSNVLAQLRPAQADTDYNLREGRTPEGTPGVFRIGPHGAAELVPGILPRGQMVTGRGALKQIPGPNGPEWAVYNSETGEFDPTGQPATTTEAQARSVLQAPLAERAYGRLLAELAPNRVQQLVAQGGWNEFLSANAERLQRNIRIIADAYARTLTGAAMREEEWQNAKLVMAPQAGDDAETVAEKLRDMELLVQQLRRIGGFTPTPLPQPPADSATAGNRPPLQFH